MAANVAPYNSAAEALRFSCSTYYPEYVVLGGGTMMYSVVTKDNVTSGWVRFDGSNGVRRKYTVEFFRRHIDGGASAVSGSFVTNGGYEGDYLYIVGEAVFAPSGILGSYTGTAVDICRDLGYNAPSS